MLVKALKQNKQFILFVLLNGFAALMNFSSRVVFSHVVNYPTAIILAYLVGMLTAYLLCRSFVFEAQQHKTAKQIFYFTLVNVFALLQTLLISLLFADYVLAHWQDQTLREAVAHGIGLAVPAITSYFGHKYITFK